MVVRTGEELEGVGQAPAVGGDVAGRAEELRTVGLVQRRVQDHRLHPLLSAELPRFKFDSILIMLNSLDPSPRNSRIPHPSYRN
jgi:hypothetical protein